VADYRANAEDVAQDIADAEVKIACPMMSLWGAYFYAVGTMSEGLAGNGQQSSPSRSGVGLTLIVQTRLTAATLEAGTNGAGRKRYERRWQMAPKYRSKTGLHL
jgi:hypothetical protein